MTIAMQPIFTRTVTGAGIASITFNNIPQTFTDLQILMSVRDTNAFTTAGIYIQVNSDTDSVYSITNIAGSGTTADSGRSSNQGSWFPVSVFQGTSTTANVFNNVCFYLPNYTGNNFKQMIVDTAVESNSNVRYETALSMTSALYRKTTAISSMIIYANATFATNSTISLYGITKG